MCVEFPKHGFAVYSRHDKPLVPVTAFHVEDLGVHVDRSERAISWPVPFFTCLGATCQEGAHFGNVEA